MDVTYGPVNVAWGRGEGQGILGRSLDFQRGAQSVQSSPTRNKGVTQQDLWGDQANFILSQPKSKDLPPPLTPKAINNDQTLPQLTSSYPIFLPGRGEIQAILSYKITNHLYYDIQDVIFIFFGPEGLCIQTEIQQGTDDFMVLFIIITLDFCLGLLSMA